MATNQDRSLNGDLSEGMTDGAYKKIATRERGGQVEMTTAVARKGMDNPNPLANWYGEVEKPVKVRPDGLIAR
jgi:hypothetical protein